jgi:hypothetical protein
MKMMLKKKNGPQIGQSAAAAAVANRKNNDQSNFACT